MPARSPQSRVFQGEVEQKSSVAVLLVDVINPFEFPGAEKLVEKAEPMARELAALCRRARKHKIPVIYANDNFGRWRSDFKELVAYCLKKKGRRVVGLLKPHADDYFVLKPKNSAFYTTTLDLLLQTIGAKRLIIGGLLADNCVLFSAHDAYLRDYKISIPTDCTESMKDRHKQTAFEQIERVLKAELKPWRELACLRRR